MRLPRRFSIYLILLVGILALQITGFFKSETNNSIANPLAAGEQVQPEEVGTETFTGKGGPKEPPLQLSLFPYEVQPGDNLWGIARRENLDLDTLISANRLQRANLINVGDILHIPNQKGVFHKVRKGQTISGIAKIYKTAVEEILEINGIEEPDAISVHKQLFIPGAKLLSEEKEYILGWGFIKPCRGWVSSRYGWRRDPFTRQRRFHRGIDLAVSTGTPIYAARDGKVILSGWSGGYGRLIVIKHTQGYSTRYGHNSVNLVKKGQKVKQGQLIARVGNTGRSTGSHLHFEIRRWGHALNPAPLIRRYARRK